MALTIGKFLEGMTPQEYVDQMKTNQKAFIQVQALVETAPWEKAYFSHLTESLRVAVFTEDFCGDSLISTPSLFRLAEDTSNLEVRVFLRDQNLELANSYLPEYRWGTVPVFVFFNQDMHEVSCFIETAPEMVPIVEEMGAAIVRAHPEISDIGKKLSEMSESTRNLFRQERITTRVAHAQEWGQIVVSSVRQVVAEGLTKSPDQRPTVGGTHFPPP